MRLEDLSPGTQEQIHQMRRHAQTLKANINVNFMQRRLECILQDLDQIPQLFDREPFVSAALNVPQSELNAIQSAYDTFNGKIEAIPDE